MLRGNSFRLVFIVAINAPCIKVSVVFKMFSLGNFKFIALCRTHWLSAKFWHVFKIIIPCVNMFLLSIVIILISFIDKKPIFLVYHWALFCGILHRISCLCDLHNRNLFDCIQLYSQDFADNVFLRSDGSHIFLLYFFDKITLRALSGLIARKMAAVSLLCFQQTQSHRIGEIALPKEVTTIITKCLQIWKFWTFFGSRKRRLSLDIKKTDIPNVGFIVCPNPDPRVKNST